MPPRRSSRPTRASVDSATVPNLASAPKRKRPSAADEDASHDEKENGAKRAAHPRKSAAASVPKTAPAIAGRRKQSLREVPESDDDEEDMPPVKKTKPSPGDDEVVEATDSEEEEEEVRPKGRKPPAKKAAQASRSRRRPTEVVDASSSEEAPTKSTRRVSGRNPPPVSRASRAPARSRSVNVEADSDEEVEAPAPAATKGRRSSAKPPSKRPSIRRPTVVEPVEEAVEEIVEEEEPDAAQASAQPLPAHAEGSDDDEAEEVAANLTLDVDGASDEGEPSADAAEVTQTPQEEEERSLLDPPPMPASQPRTQPAPEEPTGPRSRLVIHKMALVNFKSYAGRQEIGPFHKSFSAIVGPNGSGKSNTIDALLFVFGYRASKMRQGKLSELIHNSAAYEDLDFCTVEVHFREIVDLPGPDAFEVVPNSGLVVARTAYRNNSSKYTINNQPSNFTEVTTLLKGRGIDLDHKRFLILQGEVESIALMKPKAATEHEDGLLEYLEDIIGTSIYKEPIEEALLEMDRLSDDRAEKLNRLRITERERNVLEEQKRDAENYLRLQNEHARALSRMWQYYLWKCLLTGEEYTKRKNALSEELETEREQNKDDIDHLTAMEKHFAAREKLFEEVKAASAAALKDLAVHEKQEVGLEERTKHASGKAKKLKKSLDEDKRAKAEAVRAVDENERKMEKERAKAEQFESDLAKEEKELSKIQDSLKDKTQVFHDQIEVKQKELQPWMKKINQKQAQINIAQSERDTLAKKAEAAKAASQEAKEAWEQLQADQAAKDADLTQKKREKAEVNGELKGARAKLGDLKARVEDLRKKSSSKRQRVEEARSSQSQATSQNRVLDALTNLRRRGQIEGFHGRLGSLGTIDDKYDVAISTACGALHNMLVDKVDQGQACIEHLRRGNIGRASFMVLEKLDRNGGAQRIQTPENAPRLFDLVKPKDPKFAPAFYKALRDTLVATDLDQANRIAFGGQKRWRVVTLSGQLIDTSGTMAGGGSSVSRGAMSSKLAPETVSPEVLKGYQEDSDAAAQELEVVVGQLRVAESEADRLSRAGPELDMAIDKIGLDISNGQKRIAEAVKRLKDLKSQSKPDSSDVDRIAKLDEEIADTTAELEELESKSSVIDEAIKALEKKILEIGGSKLLAQKSKVDGLRLHINLANDEVTKAEVAKAKAEKDSTKLDATIKTNAKTLQDIETDLESLNEELEKCRLYVEKLKENVDAAQLAEENSKADYETLKATVEEKQEEVQAFRKKEAELERNLKDVENEIAQNEKALEHWGAQHDALKLEDVDSDDEDEDEAAEVSPADPEVDDADDAPNDAQIPVKAEEGKEDKRKGKARARTPSHVLHTYSVAELSQFNKKNLQANVALLEEQLKNANPNLGVLKEYRKREEEYLRRAKDLEDTTAQRDGQKQKYDSLRKQRLDEFMAGFNLISLKLKEMYQMITLGGNAELELVDSMDPFSEGIIFSVMPPKKSWKNISNLSGGEKTLSSLALVFALHHFKPTPLYFMDEIDAALDFRNVSIVANYIKDRTKNAQFIIISLRNDMFELSHRLIGIYKTANTTKSVSINNHALAPATSNPAPAARGSRAAA